MNKYNKIVFVNGSAPPLNADNLNHMDEGIERATDGAIALETEIATARGGQSRLEQGLIRPTQILRTKQIKLATLAGVRNYGRIYEGKNRPKTCPKAQFNAV